MNFRGKLLSALAWVGLVVVVAVPSLDALRERFAGHTDQAPSAVTRPLAAVVIAQPEQANAPAVTASPIISSVEPKAVPLGAVAPTSTAAVSASPVAAAPAPIAATTASVPAADDTPAATGGSDPVKDYIASGKALPSYVRPADSAAATVVAPAQAPAVVMAKSAPVSAPEAVVATAAMPKPAAARPKAVVTEADLKDWKSGTLEDYLRSHGLLTESATSTGD